MILETAAVIGAALGSIFVASLKQQTRFNAFVLWWIVNIYFVFHFALNGDYPLTGLYFFYVCTAMYGMWNNFPRKENYNTSDTFWSDN